MAQQHIPEGAPNEAEVKAAKEIILRDRRAKGLDGKRTIYVMEHLRHSAEEFSITRREISTRRKTAGKDMYGRDIRLSDIDHPTDYLGECWVFSTEEKAREYAKNIHNYRLQEANTERDNLQFQHADQVKLCERLSKELPHRLAQVDAIVVEVKD